jgi:hypothetical protein
VIGYNPGPEPTVTVPVLNPPAPPPPPPVTVSPDAGPPPPPPATIRYSTILVPEVTVKVPGEVKVWTLYPGLDTVLSDPPVALKV